MVVAVAALLVAGALAARAQPVRPTAACDAQRDRCRGDCFDRFSRGDAAAFARCKDACNRTWLGCTSAPR
jgi:hypothetical protein